MKKLTKIPILCAITMHRFIKLVIFCVLTGLLVACANFHPKPISAAGAVAEFESRTLDNSSLKEFLEVNLHHEITPWPPMSWSFTMLTLVAFYYHPDLDVARAQWGVAKAGVITAGGRPNPSVGFTPQYNVNAASGFSPWTLGFTLDIPMETAGKRGYRVAQSKHLSEAARLNIASVAWQVRSRLRSSLINLCVADQSETILKREQLIQQNIVQLLEQRLALGEVSQPDVTQGHISLDQIRLSLSEMQKQGAEARVQLADALGLPVSAFEGANISFDILDWLPTDLPSQDLRREALRNRPDTLGALAEYAASQSALQIEIAKQYPDIHLGPGYSWDQGNNKWSIGLSVSLPVFNLNQGAISEAEAHRAEAHARFTALQARVLGELDRALAGYRASLQTLEVADALLSAKRTQLESAQAMFNIGEEDRLVLLSAQLELDSIALSRLEALVKSQKSFGLLEDAMQRPIEPLESFPVAPETNPRAKEENNK